MRSLWDEIGAMRMEVYAAKEERWKQRKFEYVKEWEKEFTIAHTDFVGIFVKRNVRTWI